MVSMLVSGSVTLFCPVVKDYLKNEDFSGLGVFLSMKFSAYQFPGDCSGSLLGISCC